MQYKPTEAGQEPIVLAEAQTVVDKAFCNGRYPRLIRL